MPYDPRDERNPAYTPEEEIEGVSDRWGPGTDWRPAPRDPYSQVWDESDTGAAPTTDDWYGAVPFDLGGETARQDRERADWEANRRRDMWSDLGRSAPTADDLTPQYLQEGQADEYGNLIGDPSQLEGWDGGESRDVQMRALRNLTEYGEQGGLRSGDRAAMQQGRLERGAWMRGQNDAAIQQAQARGMGGSGAELAMRLGASQSANNANAMGDASIMQGAQARALQAMQAGGAMASQAYDQDAARRSALDAFNQQNMGWRRERETRNTGTVNRQQDANTTARQQAYQNQERAVAGIDQQYSTDASTRAANSEQAQENANAQGEAAGDILEWLCCHPDTPIATPDGDKRIADLREGDLVLTVHKGRVEARAIRAAQSVSVKDHTVQRMRLGNGMVLSISPSHPTAEGYGIGELVAGDYLGGVRIAATELVPYNAKATYDILPDSDTATYFAGGAHLGTTMRRTT